MGLLNILYSRYSLYNRMLITSHYITGTYRVLGLSRTSAKVREEVIVLRGFRINSHNANPIRVSGLAYVQSSVFCIYNS